LNGDSTVWRDEDIVKKGKLAWVQPVLPKFRRQKPWQKGKVVGEGMSLEGLV